ncbi:hypothetical protein MauCBS54593_008044 [Microsporum audouinii]
MPRNWERLPLYNKSYPPLLFSYEPSPSGYEVFLTDLAHIWSENLSHKQIINRASKDETSIDPSQDGEQYSVLLQKIGDALHGSKGTSMCLSGNSTGSSFKLVTTTKLPKPLEPLEWALNLSRSSPSVLTQHLLLPALQNGLRNEDRQNSLYELLKEKDKIIGKLLDKIESSGIDLSTVFPNMANIRLGQKRGSLFSQASKLVKGVSPFDKTSWENLHLDRGPSNFGLNSLGKCLYDEDLFEPRNIERIENEWWNHPTSSSSCAAQHTEKKAPHDDIERGTEKGTIESEDEFQRQETPPGLRGTEGSPSPSMNQDKSDIEVRLPMQHEKGRRKSPQISGGSTILSSIGKRKEQKRSHQNSYDSTTSDASEAPSHPREKPKALGTIGGKKLKMPLNQEEPSLAVFEEKAALKPHTLSNEDDQPTASEVESDSSDGDDGNNEASKQKRQNLPQQKPADVQGDNTRTQQAQNHRQAALRTRGGLGQIGGKKQKDISGHKVHGKESIPAASSGNTTDDAEENENEDENRNQANNRSKQREPNLSPGRHEQSVAAPKPHKRSGKLGTIGGAKDSQKSAKTQERNVSSSTAFFLDSEGGSDHGAGKVMNEGQESTKPTLPLPASSRSTGQQGEEQKSDNEESPEEKADRKRQELRRQLEMGDKGQSKPAKKKRKF